MILEEIVMHNFGVFCGRHRAELAPPSEGRPVVLFGGLNGNGKTTILRAIELALYGPLARSPKENHVGYDDYLRRWINRHVRASDGASVEVSLRVTTDGRQRTYRIRRSWRVRGDRVKENLDVYVDGNRDSVVSDTWREHIETLIPAQLSHLFLFDGERIETLADPESSSELLETAIHALLGVDLVDQLGADLRVLQDRRKLPSVSQDERNRFDELEKQLTELEQGRTSLKQDLAGLANVRKWAVEDVEKVEARFRQAGGELADSREMMERKRSEIDGDRKALNAQLIDLAAGPLPLALLKDQLLSVGAQARKEVQCTHARILASTLEERDAALLAALQKKKAAHSIMKAAESFLAGDRAKRHGAAVAECHLQLDELGLARCEILLDKELGQECRKAEGLLTQLDQTQAALDDIDRRLAKVPDQDSLSGLLKELSTTRERLAKCDQAIAVANARLQEIEKQKAMLTKQRQDLLHSGKETELANKDTHRFIEHSERVRNTLTQFKSALIKANLSRLEDLILEGYRRLLRKSSLVSALRIDPSSFSLELWNGDSDRLPSERLSAGERQLLAVSMLWGLGRATGRTLPVVIDTPLGRLDSAHRSHLVERYFPFASHQVILLSTDEEIDQALFETIKPRLGRVYRLEYNDETASSSILPGYFWQKGDL